MKRLLVRITLLTAYVVIFQTAIKAQPEYIFKNCVRVSGGALQTGTKYKFSNVKPGVDAMITIKAQTGGVTLTDIDNNATGYDEAFQPFISIPQNSNGYVEFQVDFVNPAGNPMTQSYIPVTCIDVDGVTYSDGVLHERDQVQFFPGYVDFSMTGGNLVVTQPTGWVRMQNTSGVSYTGIDTSAKDVMATVMNRNISSFLIRIGGLNTSPTKSEVRYRSVYFKTFNYGHPTPLPNRTMLSLSGARKHNDVELKGILSSSHSYNKMIIERTNSASSFSYIGEIDISEAATTSTFPFTFLDAHPENGVNYYRIRLVNTHANTQEITNTLMVKMDNDQKDLEVINTVVQGNNPVLSIRSQDDKEVDLQLTDMSGRTIKNTKTKLNSGFNNINLSGLNSAKGYYVLIVRTTNTTISQKLMIQ